MYKRLEQREAMGHEDYCDDDGLSEIRPFCNQVYSDIVRRCIERNELFEDPEFQAKRTSLYKRHVDRCPVGVKWLRPKESPFLCVVHGNDRCLYRFFHFEQEARIRPVFVQANFDSRKLGEKQDVDQQASGRDLMS